MFKTRAEKEMEMKDFIIIAREISFREWLGAMALFIGGAALLILALLIA